MAFLSPPRLSSANSGVLNHYMTLPQHNKVQAEYIWIGGTGQDIRSKTKTLSGPIKSLADLPDWNYDGSSTAQAEGHFSEVWLRPVKMVADPFRCLPNILVLCETLDARSMEPLPTNRRGAAKQIFDEEAVKDEEPWYGIEQEYTLFEADDTTPLGWPRHGFPAPQGPYYCGVGKGRANGRHLVEAHYRACLYAGLEISGINAEVMPGQWEFQVGPCLGIDSGDQLWLARYILQRVGEDFNVCVSFDPKPIQGDWNGAGNHTNYSTKSMRTAKSKDADDAKSKCQNTEQAPSEQKQQENRPGSANAVREDTSTAEVAPEAGAKDGPEKKSSLLGIDAILAAIAKLATNHDKHMKLYGKGNEQRLSGTHETAKFNEFSYGVANRGASIRIPRQCDKDGYGYLEDRRPAANCDPYDVTSIIAQTTLLL